MRGNEVRDDKVIAAGAMVVVTPEDRDGRGVA